MFRIALGLVIAVTVGWKIVLATQPIKSDQIDFAAAVGGFLTWQDYMVESEVIDGLPIVTAVASNCRFVVAKLDHLAWQFDMVQDLASTDRKVFFVFRGAVHKKPPVLLSVTDHYWSRFLRELGFARPDALMIAVMAPPHCNAERIPWSKFSSSLSSGT